MELSLRNVDSIPRISGGTACYSAELYIAGHRAGAVTCVCDELSVEWTNDELMMEFFDWLDDETVPFEFDDGKIELLTNINQKLEATIQEAARDAGLEV